MLRPPRRLTVFLAYAVASAVLSITVVHAQTIERRISVEAPHDRTRHIQERSFEPSSAATHLTLPPAVHPSTSNPPQRPRNDLRSVQQQRDAVRLASHSEPASVPKYEPIPLSIGKDPRTDRGRQRPARSSGQAATTVVTSLTIVLAAFFLLVWVSRKTAPQGLSPLPGEVVESLGRAQLTARQQMQLIRLGRKLVLLSVTSTGVETITEVTDLDEVDRLCSLCQKDRSGSVTESFRQVLSQYATEPAPNSFVGDPSVSQVELANRDARHLAFEEDDDV